MEKVTKEQVREVINNQSEWYSNYNDVEFIVWVKQDDDEEGIVQAVSTERIAEELGCEADDIDLDDFMQTEYFENHVLYDLVKKVNEHIDFDLPYELR